jgi:hypothetical protein
MGGSHARFDLLARIFTHEAASHNLLAAASLRQ